MKNWGIRKRVLFLAVAPATAIALLLTFYFTSVRLEDMDRALSERGMAIVRHLAPASEYGVFSGNREVLQRFAAAVQQETDVWAVVITDADGQVLASSGGARDFATLGADMPGVTTATAQNGMLLVFSAPIMHSQVTLEDYLGSESMGLASAGVSQRLGRVTVALSREGLLLHKRRLLVDGLLIALLGLIGSTLLALRMSREVTGPILDLSDAVKKLEEGQLATRVAPQSGGELQLLEHGVNAMAQALQAAQSELERRVHEATVELWQKKNEAEQATQAKSRFLAAASHDLRQPMHALGLFVAVLRDKVHDQETHQLVEQIAASSTAMEDLLDSLLDISKFDAGMLSPQWDIFELEPLLERVCHDFAALADSKGIRLHVRPTFALVRSDPLLLERILLNLVSNAVRYTERGGVLVGCRRRAGKLRIEVWDSGVGIPHDQQRAIFQEFYQIGNSERDRRKGMGLGLAIVDRLARLLGHSLTVRSVVGRGSVFSLEIPLGDEADHAKMKRDRREEVYRLDGMVVLVVEDDALALHGMVELLTSWGCLVISATTGDEALDKLGDGRPQIVVCDYRLPNGENGIQVVEKLRSLLGEGLPAVLISADTTPALLEQTRVSGCHLLHKPLRPAKLRALLNHLRNRK